MTVTLNDAAVPGESRVATVEYDLTALSAEAATELARFAAGYPSSSGTGKRRSRLPPGSRTFPAPQPCPAPGA